MKAYGLPRYLQLSFLGDIFNQREFAPKSIYYKCPNFIKYHNTLGSKNFRTDCIYNCLKCVKGQDLHSTVRDTKTKKRIRRMFKRIARAKNKEIIRKEYDIYR